MNIEIFYDNGRVDEFNTERFTVAEPFEGCNMLTNFEVCFDSLDTESLWLQAHFYDIRSEYRQKEQQDLTPTARRMRGWRFLLVDKNELSSVSKILVNREVVAWRFGATLINGIRFNAMELACFTDETTSSISKKAIVLHDYLANADPLLAADEDELCSRFGFSREAYEQVVIAEGCQPQRACVAEGEGKEERLDEEDVLKAAWLADFYTEEEHQDAVIV